jgi:hypothetical protein
MGAKTSKIILTAEQAAYVRALIPLLKAVRAYPYFNRRTPLFFDACDAFLKSIRDCEDAAAIRHNARMVDVTFHKWQRKAFGGAIIPAQYHMMQPVNYAWPAVPTAAPSLSKK